MSNIKFQESSRSFPG